MKKLAVCLLLLALLLCSGCSASAKMNKYSVVFADTFDTVITLIGYAESEESFNEQAALVHSLYRQYHKLYDTYHSYEDEGIISVYTLNERAAREPVAVDPMLFHLLTFCKSHYEACQEQVNIAMGSVLSLWHAYREEGLDHPSEAKLPPMDELEAAAMHIDLSDLILDSEKMTVYYADPKLKLDIGAVAKGYATEAVAQTLLSGDMPSFILSAGGNVRMGNPPRDGRKCWSIGIQDPEGNVLGSSDIVETLYLTNCSVVTSGDYQRYYTVDGKRYHHLIDPDTLMPGSFYRSVSIITEDSGMADMLSTAAFLMPYEESRAFIESLDGVDAIWLFDDGSKKMTDGAKAVAKSYGAAKK